MTEQEFKRMIIGAKDGEIMAIEALLEMYEPLINKYSYINGIFDVDLKQVLMLRVLQQLNKFQI